MITPLCRGGCFLLQSREQPSPRSLSNIKKSAVQRGEDISKKIGEMSCNFGEIIKKLYSFVWWKARKKATHATPHPSAQRNGTFYTWRAGKCDPRTQFLLAEFTRGGGGRRGGKNAKQCHSLTDHRIICKLKTKIANTILLLCYLDKICLSLTGGLWQASANLYSEEKL